MSKTKKAPAKKRGTPPGAKRGPYNIERKSTRSISIRMPTETYEKLKADAAAAGKSLNAHCVEKLSFK